MHEMTTIGNYNYFGHRTMALNCRVGSYCSIASDVKLGQMEHDLECVSTSTHIFPHISKRSGISKPTVIENDVWIAANSVVKQGVTIGTGAVVGAGAVVTRDVPPYAIVAGVPAKVIRFRFEDEKIRRILNSKWWTYSKVDAQRICMALENEEAVK